MIRRADGGTTPDGSPIELYRALGTEGEPELIHRAIPRRATILELGAGVGRVTRGLVALGHPVVAVDESADALRFVRGAKRVRSRIEDLDLGRRFGCVLLMSNLVNAPAARRRVLLEICARHLAPRGALIIERLSPRIRSGISDGEYGGLRVRLEARRRGSSLSGIVTYDHPDGRGWQHSFSGSVVLDDRATRRTLTAAGLRLDHWLDPQRRWLVARPRG